MLFFYRAPDLINYLTVWQIQILMQVGISSFVTLYHIAPPCLKQAWETESASLVALARWRDTTER